MAALLSVTFSIFDSLLNREAREAKRGGTAPGESRIHKQANFELNKIYAVNPRIQKINIASPSIKNASNATIQNESITVTKPKAELTNPKPRIKFTQGLGLNRNEPIK